MQKDATCEKGFPGNQYFIATWGKRCRNTNIAVFALYLEEIFSEDSLIETIEDYDTFLEKLLEFQNHDFHMTYRSDVFSTIMKHKSN